MTCNACSEEAEYRWYAQHEPEEDWRQETHHQETRTLTAWDVEQDIDIAQMTFGSAPCEKHIKEHFDRIASLEEQLVRLARGETVTETYDVSAGDMADFYDRAYAY